MVNLKKYSLSGEVLEEISFSEALMRKKANPQMVKDYLVAIRNNARQWSANTKERADVKCSTKKPRPQKGTGNARQGYLAAPQFRGGGVVFGPKPKFDQHVKINKKERRATIQAFLSQKIEEGTLRVLQINGLKQPKTKTAQQFLKHLGLEGKRVLILGSSTPALAESAKMDAEHFILSMRNIPKTGFIPLHNVSGYDLALYREVIVLDSAFEELKEILERGRDGK